jgi:hypothetical protein
VAPTPVPKTAIDKNGEAQLPYHEIRPTGNAAMAAPACHSSSPQNLGQSQLSVLIAA